MNNQSPYDLIINSDVKGLEEYLQNIDYSNFGNEFLISSIIGASIYLKNEKMISFLIKFVKKNKLSIGKREVIEGVVFSFYKFRSVITGKREIDYYINLMYIEPYSSFFS